LTLNPRLLSERTKAVLETMRMKLSEEQSLTYLKEVGFQCSHATLYREKTKLEKMKLKRLYHIAQIGFQDQHLETIDQYEMGFKMMWQNVLRERDPYKQNSMIRDILLLKPYLSSYYEATKLIIDKKQSEYKEFLDKQEQQQHEQEEQQEEDEDDEEEELNGDSYSKYQQQESTKAIPTNNEFRRIEDRSLTTPRRTESTTIEDDNKNRKF